jgi:hypothetical protein
MALRPFVLLLALLAGCSRPSSTLEYDIAFGTAKIVPHTAGVLADPKPWLDAVDPSHDHSKGLSNACGTVDLEYSSEPLQDYLVDSKQRPKSTRRYRGVIGEFCTSAEFNVTEPTVLLVYVRNGERFLRSKAIVHVDAVRSPYVDDAEVENREFISTVVDNQSGRWCSGDPTCRAHRVYLSVLGATPN